MTEWNEFFSSIQTAVEQLKINHCPDPYFRGQGNSSFKLEPTLARERYNPKFHNNKEKRLFWDFRMLGSHLLSEAATDWDVLFFMQHHGMPTRLLDWTTIFSNALHFALKSPADEIAVWILNPYALNKISTGESSVSNINVSFKMDYLKFLNLNSKPPGALAISGDSKVGRIHAQNAAFTLHSDLNKPLEILYPTCLQKRS